MNIEMLGRYFSEEEIEEYIQQIKEIHPDRRIHSLTLSIDDYNDDNVILDYELEPRYRLVVKKKPATNCLSFSNIIKW